MATQLVKEHADLMQALESAAVQAPVSKVTACMLGGLAHKWNWREARTKSGKDASKPNMVTGGKVQIVWKKLLRYFDVEPCIVVRPHLNRNTIEILADDIERACAYLDEHGGTATPPKLHAAEKTSPAKC